MLSFVIFHFFFARPSSFFQLVSTVVAPFCCQIIIVNIMAQRRLLSSDNGRRKLTNFNFIFVKRLHVFFRFFWIFFCFWIITSVQRKFCWNSTHQYFIKFIKMFCIFPRTSTVWIIILAFLALINYMLKFFWICGTPLAEEISFWLHFIS